MEMMQWDHEKGAPSSKLSRGQNRLFHYRPEARGKRSAARFREVGGAL
jgi:hypothetical protein